MNRGFSTVHPENTQHFKFSAGLVHITGKKATQIAHDALTVFKRYSITPEDLFRHVNDMTPSALAGRLIVGSNDSGTCGMHKCELITKHTGGQVTRRKKK